MPITTRHGPGFGSTFTPVADPSSSPGIPLNDVPPSRPLGTIPTAEPDYDPRPRRDDYRGMGRWARSLLNWTRRRRPATPTEPEPKTPTNGGGTPGPTDPFDKLADAFMSAMGGNSTPKDTTPYVVVDPNYNEGSGMNWKGVAVLALVGVGIWFAWKKWGGKVAAAAGGE